MEDDIDYQSHRQEFAQVNAAENLLKRYREPITQEATETAVSATKPKEERRPSRGPVAVAGSVISDIGRGVTEAPRAVLKGVRDALQETVDLTKSLSDWMDENVGTITIGSEGINAYSPSEVKEKGPAKGVPDLPDIRKPETVTGNMVEGISQFLTGFAGAGKLLPIAPATRAGQVALAAGKGAIADFAVFDPHEKRLANLIEQFPALSNPVTQYLAADPEDSEAEGRFKNAAEGLGLGLITDGLALGLKALKKSRLARQASEVADLAEPLVKPDDFKVLGDAEKPLVYREAVKKADAASSDVVIPTRRPGLPETVTVGPASFKTTPINKPVFRETNATGLDDLLIANREGNAANYFVADNMDLAIGQGDNKGVMVRLRGEAVSGVPSTSKPGATIAKGQEYTIDYLGKDAVDEIIMPKSTRLRGTSRKILSRDFDKTDLGDGRISLTRKKDIPPVDLGVPDDIAAKGITQKTEPETFINFARIDTQDDVKNVMQQMADAYKAGVTKKRRGTQTFKEIELNAEQVNAWDTLMSRRTGDPLNAEQSVAARRLWASSADKLTTLAKEAASNPSETNLFAFRKMMAVHQSIQGEVIAARTETARALASWRIPTGATRLKDLDTILQGHGGADMSREMAQRVATLAEKGMISEMDRFIEKGAFAKTRDAMLEAWINGLLSGPKTHMVNAMSNTSVIFQQMYERAVAARISRALGDEGGVQIGEAMAQYSGLVNGLRDGLRYAKKTFQTGESGFGLGKVDLPRQDAISAEAFNIASDTWLGRSVDVMGRAANIPTRPLAASDEFFKTVGYRMELHALATRQAAQEASAGLIKADGLKTRIGDIITAPPNAIKFASIDQATYQTFTNTPGTLAKSISKVVNEYPALRLILPFVRTPANIMRYSFERTPLAPLMKHVRADLAAGGARRDLVLARVATGTTIMMVSADMAMNAEITGRGPSNTAERQALLREGWQPYSVKAGDRYYAYNRLDPLGMTLGLAADMSEILANDDYGPDKEKSLEETAVAVSISIANNAMSKTYLSGLADFMEAMSDPTRYGEGFFQRLAGSAVPTGVAEITRFQDPYMREAHTMVDAIRKRTPGLSDDLPPRHDLWGRPISYQSGLGAIYDAVSPIYSKQEKPEPIDQEILRLEASVTMPNKKTSFDGVTINLERYPEAYSRYVELAGNALKHPAWDMGAKDLLNAVISGRHPLSPVYEMRSDGPDGQKAEYIRSVINDYRELARKQLLEEFPEIKADYDLKQEQRRSLKLGVAAQ